MIKLKNVSKFYYSKGVIASGFSKVNLEFNIGEFVAITGESGSGKSTLLNVISGLDSYEEGEMYINGEETSHYSAKDFEDYRRKYIGNIFQNFNLVNSYTVYQNIELVLLLNGNKKKDIKKKVLDLIKTVGLYKFRNSKVSKLSGGQKQRVAIARSLAKDTPIIIADEPTGNLDSKSALEIIKLLSEIAKNKLVIIVTHNYEQVEPYVTRKIKMHDGKVLEDKIIKEHNIIDKTDTAKYDNITFLNKIRLEIRNTFNIIPKFLLLMAVFLFITVAIISEYASFKEQQYISSKQGDNYYFTNKTDTRIVLKKSDNTVINDDDYTNIKKLDNIDYIVKNDLMLDSYINLIDNENFWINGLIDNIDNLKGSVDLGRFPEANDEIVLAGNKNIYHLSNQADLLLKTTLYIQDMYSGSTDNRLALKVVGIKYIDTNNYDTYIYANENVINGLLFQTNQRFSTIKTLFMDKYLDNPRVTYNSNVLDGNVYIPSDLNYMCKNENCVNQRLYVELDNLYYKDTLDLNVLKSYTKKNIKALLNIDDYDSANGTIYISVNDYNRLFNKGNYQSSVFVKDVKNIYETNDSLKDLGYKTLVIKDTLINNNATEILRIVSTTITIILIVTLFFITYFVIRIILKSRNVYFSTLRMLGATKKVSKSLLIGELLIVSNLSYFLFLIVILLNKFGYISVKFINTINKYLQVKDYIILYIILVVMAYLISEKFAKKLFKNTAITTINEEV